MATQFSRNWPWAFVLGPENVKRIWELLEQRVGAVTARAHGADSMRHEFETLNALIAFENASGKQLQSLELSATARDPRKEASVEFGGIMNPISVSIAAGDTNQIALVRDDLLDAINGTKAWYSAISRIDLGWVLIAVVMFLGVVGTLAVGDSPPRPGLTLSQAIIQALVVVAFLGVSGFACWGMHRLHKRYFPTSFFALGQGESRFALDDKVRWVVIVGFAISAFASLVVAIMLR